MSYHRQIKRKLDAVSKVLSMATRWTDERGLPLLPAKPTMPSIRVANLRDRVLSRAEEEAAFAAIEARRQAQPTRDWRRFRVLLRFLLDTGARLGEALQTTPESITLRELPDGTERAYVTFERYRTKSDKPRTVPLTAATLAALREIEADAVPDRIGGAPLYFPIKVNTAWYYWSNLREDLSAQGFDLSDVVLHTMRHTCLSRLARGGMDLLRLQRWAGHSSPAITAERYAHLIPEDLDIGADLLDGATGAVGKGYRRNHATLIPNESPANGAEAGTPLLH